MEECPHCDKIIRDLWDYGWGAKTTIEFDCPHCDKPIIAEAEIEFILRKEPRP